MSEEIVQATERAPVRSITDLPKVPPHPIRRQALVFLVLAGSMIVLALILRGPIGLLISPLTWLGVALAFFARYMARSGDAAQIVNRALDALTAGRFDEVHVLLNHADGQFKSRYIQRVVRLHRAGLAWMEGDLKGAESELDRAVDPKIGFLAGDADRKHVQMAHAFRAIVRAASGNEKDARHDIAIVRASPQAGPDSIARAEVAQALLLQRSGERAALEAHLDEHASLFEHATPRDRLMLRTFRRMLRLSASNVYRRPVPRIVSPGRAKLKSWIANIAPGADDHLVDHGSDADAPEDASLLRRPRTIDREAMTEARQAHRRAHTKPEHRGFRWKLLLTWLLTIGMFLAIWNFFSDAPSTPRPRPPSPPTIPFDFIVLGVAAVVVGIGALAIRRQRRATRRMMNAGRDLAQGRTEKAVLVLEQIAAEPLALPAAEASLLLARMAEHRGDFEEAVSSCDRGLSRVNERAANRAASSDILTPMLLAERAYALTALDRFAESEVALETLRKNHPSYAFLGAATFRVRLLQHVRTGNLEGAERLARSRSPELPLPVRDELLADALSITSEDDPNGEVRGHIKEEIARIEEGDRWMQRVAPAVLASLQRARVG